MSGTPSILAVADHTGWAHIVCVSARDLRPFVVTRRRIALIEAGLPTQPYEHETRAMRADPAQALVARVKRSVDKTTSLALRRLADELSGEHPVAALSIRTPPFDTLPEAVADVHASYQLLCAADGMLYHRAICNAAARLGLEVEMCRRNHEIRSAASALGIREQKVEAFVTESGRPPGPPWTLEHRRGYAAGIAALARRVHGLTLA